MSRIRDALVSRENLTWAWRKAQRLYRTADGPVDFAAVAAFELDLERNLTSIAKDIQTLSYRLGSLVLVPQPKKPDGAGNQRLRQSFHVSVRDQVAWLAIVNIVGPTLDSRMPAWSYGHRLYRAVWFKPSQGRAQLELGPYRHNSGNLYRRFKHSWPLFRRHVSLTARRMVNSLGLEEELTEPEIRALNYAEKPSYLRRGYWSKVDTKQLFYASIDLEKFYPRISTEAIIRGFSRYLPDYSEDRWFRILIRKMLNFRVGVEGSHLLGDPIVEPVTNEGKFDGIPTGLMVAGFLSNVAMLRLDRLVTRRLQKSRRIAHFRFVDDHAFLAYDFDELRAWIRQYERYLKKLEIGPNISSTKFDPPEMAAAYSRTAVETSVAEAKARSEIDGENPVKLMTKTLALVSELAGTDFDILSEASREQRLTELDWLLQADLPDREIRSDTRASFAAGKITGLVPIAFAPSLDLLKASRELADLKAAKKPDDRRLATAKTLVASLEDAERQRYRTKVRHYFKHIFQAFCDHPAKPRLFIRVLDYCRLTGHSGTQDVLAWLLAQSANQKKAIAEYLQPLALQVIAQHLVTASFDLTNLRRLSRQRWVAREYLRHLSSRSARSHLKTIVDGAQSNLAATSSRACLLAAVACATDIVARQSAAESSNLSHARLHSRLKALSIHIGAPRLTSTSRRWEQKTGMPVGVWTHWLDSLIQNHPMIPGSVWRITAPQHTPENRLDWQSLRKGPNELAKSHSRYLIEDGVRQLDSADGGWLLDYLRSPQAVALPDFPARLEVVQQVRLHVREQRSLKGFVTAWRWAAALKHTTPHDPRNSEWTALEILRQLIGGVRKFHGRKLETLDELNPSNILLPKAWLESIPPKDTSHSRWTWESWKSVVRANPTQVSTCRYPISDYRREELGEIGDDGEAQWRRRLRGCGLLLLGLLSRNFDLPAAWNVNGLERNTSNFLRQVLEEVPISSRSLAILEGALLPRSIETALMRQMPWAFLGAKSAKIINDTTTDPPLLLDLDDLWDAVAAAQATLESNQASVLDHAPRQLIPMNVTQLVHAAVEIIDQDVDE